MLKLMFRSVIKYSLNASSLGSRAFWRTLVNVSETRNRERGLLNTTTSQTPVLKNFTNIMGKAAAEERSPKVESEAEQKEQ